MVQELGTVGKKNFPFLYILQKTTMNHVDMQVDLMENIKRNSLECLNTK